MTDSTDLRLAPRYEAVDAGAMVRVDPRTVRHWLKSRGQEKASFADLLAIRLARHLREDYGFSRQRAFRAVVELLERCGPLGAGTALWVAPRSLWTTEKLQIGTGGQHALPAIVEQVALQLELDAENAPVRWFPAGPGGVVIDPEVRWGTPVLVGTRIPTWAIHRAWVVHGANLEAYRAVAEDYGLEANLVEAAVAFEARAASSVAA